MRFTFKDRVVLLDTVNNRDLGVAGRCGEVVGISYEDNEPDQHLAYAVMLDDLDRVYSILPEELRHDGR